MSYTQELSVAIEAVRLASSVCSKVQAELALAQQLEKGDKSPVTVADFAAQAVVCRALQAGFEADPVVGEEGGDDLRPESAAALCQQVTDYVLAAIGEAASSEEVIGWIDRGGFDPKEAPDTKRYWTLDPIDGTKGFLRGEQYAVALALIENGKVVLGVLGCPNLQDGLLQYAIRGEGAYELPMNDMEAEPKRIQVRGLENVADARFCESVESGHSDQDQSVQIAKALGITEEALRMDSQCKYAAVARGDADLYLRLPTRPGYQEKIWDHGAGSIVIEEAGGILRDVDQKELDFGQGRTLAENRGVVACGGSWHQEVGEAVSAVLAK